MIQKINQAISSLQVSFDIEYIKLLTAFAAALLLYKNCHRSRVVQNLTIEEFHKRQTNADNVIISCINHKTGPQGRAQLVATKNTEVILIQYMQLVRQHIQPAEFQYVILFNTKWI